MQRFPAPRQSQRATCRPILVPIILTLRQRPERAYHARASRPRRDIHRPVTVSGDFQTERRRQRCAQRADQLPAIGPDRSPAERLDNSNRGETSVQPGPYIESLRPSETEYRRETGHRQPQTLGALQVGLAQDLDRLLADRLHRRWRYSSRRIERVIQTVVKLELLERPRRRVDYGGATEQSFGHAGIETIVANAELGADDAARRKLQGADLAPQLDALADRQPVATGP